MIHLTELEVALKEIYRVLKPGGILYVVDVNDSTFEGPEVIKEMIEKHTEFYEGNRNILNILPYLAEKQSLELNNTFSVEINNLGTEDEPIIENNALKLGRMKSWAMFSFISQREDIQEYYQKAEQHYFSSLCGISIQIQTQVYQKK